MQPFILNTDGDPRNQPDKTSRLNINVNLDYEYGSISTEDGNNPLHLFPTEETPRATIIGKIPLKDGNLVQFSVISGNSTINGVSQRLVTGEIGVLSPNGNYRIIVRDNGPDPATGDNNTFGWDLNTQIQGIYKINNDGTISIYWVDGTNPLRTLNIDSPQLETDNYNRIVSTAEFSKLFALADFTQPDVSLISVDNNGNLPTGVYYTVLVYADENFNETNVSFPYGPVSIVNEIVHAPVSEYDGAVANTSSSKSYTIAVTAADTTFTYFRIYVIAKINSVFSVYDYGYQAITSTGDCSYQIDTLVNKPTSTLDILVNKVSWIPKTITQLDNKAYVFNLKTKERPNLQPWINGIVVDVADDIVTEWDAEAFNESYHSELNITTQRVFQYDDVYALYASVIFKDGSESELYHIPGRDAVNVDLLKSDASTTTVLENASIISAITAPNYNIWTFNGGGATDTSPGGEIFNLDPSAKIFHAFNCSDNANVTNVKGTGVSSKLGYWENLNETYPDTLDWVIKGSDGTIYGEDLRTNVVRHHKTPTVEGLQTDGPYEFNRLAFKFSNIQLPAEYEGEITHIRFHYAKRTNENRLVFGQSILLQDNTLLDKDNLPFADSTPLYSNNFSFSLGTTVELEDFETGGTGATQFKNMPLLANRFRMSPFDCMIGNIDPSAASYIKIFSYLSGTFTGNATSISNSSPILNYSALLDFVPATVTNVTNYANYIRRLGGNALLAESVPAYPNGDVGASVNAGQLNFTKNTVHYRAEKHIIIETANDVDKAVLYPNGILTFTTSSGTQGVRDILLANLCIYKTDLYNSFDSQETVATTGFTALSTDAFNGNAQVVEDVYGGDTFVSICGHRGVADALPALNMATPGNTAGEWRVLHTYLCESNANINYRHQGSNQYDLYYPKSTADSVLAIPLLPNGEGNYYGYNSDYTSVNDLVQPDIHQKNNITTVNHFPTRCARSATDNPESPQDNYRIFLANEYVDIEKSKGAINNAINYNNRLILQHETSIKATATRDRIKTDDSEAFIGAGDLFDYPPKDLVLTNSGYGGLKHQFASVLTQYGVFFIDHNTNKVFLLGEELKPISDEGVSLFFLRNTKLSFESYYKDLVFSLTPVWTNSTYLATGKVVKYNNALWKNNTVINPADGNPPSLSNSLWDLIYSYDNFTFKGEDSVYYGYIAGFDNFYRRYLLTKKDITVTATFTTNFKGEYDETLISGWTSNTSLFIYNNQLYIKRASTGIDIVSLPGGYYGEPIYFNNLTYFTPNRFTIAYYPEHKGWASWYNYYPDNYLYNNEQLFTQRNTVLSEFNEPTLILIPDNSGPVDSIVEPIFNNGEPARLLSVQWKTKALDNSNNEEVLTTFDSLQAYDSFQLSKENAIVNTSNSRNLEGFWSCNDFRDDTLDNNVRVVDNSLWYRPLNNSNLNLSKHWSKIKKLVDFWFGVRFKYTTYTEVDIMEHPSSYSNTTADTGISYVTATLYTDPALTVGDVLKLVSANGNVYAKVISNVSTDVWKIKAYGPITFSGSNMAITAIFKLTKKAKLHLLDVTKLIIKNIR